MENAIYSLKKRSKKSKKGFTLIELVVVIAILGILAAILIPVIGGFITRANRSANLANARNVFNSAAIFFATNVTSYADEAAAIAAAEAGIVDMVDAATADYSIDLAGSGKTWTVVSATYGTTPAAATYTSDGTITYA